MKVISKHGDVEVPADVIGKVCPVFDFAATLGVVVEKHTVKSAPDADLWAIKVGEEGRNRWRSSLLVVGATANEAGHRVIEYATIAETRSGFPKLVAAPPCEIAEYAIVHLPLGIGFRGGNGYTGDVASKGGDGCYTFDPSPWIPLAEGEIAQGDAGRMGGGVQLVALLPRGVVGRTYRTGRLYGAPASYYWYFDGVRLLKRTYEERAACAEVDGDAFPLLKA